MSSRDRSDASASWSAGSSSPVPVTSRASSAASQSVIAAAMVVATPVVSTLRPVADSTSPVGVTGSGGSRSIWPSDQAARSSVTVMATSHSSQIGCHGCDQAVTATGDGSTPW